MIYQKWHVKATLIQYEDNFPNIQQMSLSIECSYFFQFFGKICAAYTILSQCELTMLAAPINCVYFYTKYSHLFFNFDFLLDFREKISARNSPN